MPALIDILGVLGVLGFGGLGLHGVLRSMAARRAWHEQMRADLREALKARDHRRLDDFLVVWGDRMSSKLETYVQQRRDQLFIEANDERR